MSDKYKSSNSEGLYFLTLTAVEWVDVFTRKEYKQVIVDSLRYCQQHKGLVLYAWCLMPSHLHLIASAAPDYKLGAILRDFKKFTTKAIVKLIQTKPESRRDWLLYRFEFAGKCLQRIEQYKMWQDGSHAVELVSVSVLRQKLAYVHHNPVNDWIVTEPEHYLFSSAAAYAGAGGLLEVEFLE